MSLQNLSVPPAWRAGAAAAAAITAVAASATITTASDRLASCVIRLPSFLSDRDHLRTLEREVRACGRENVDPRARTSGPEWARPCSDDRIVGCYLPMTNVPASTALSYLASPAANVALKAYDADFWVSFMSTDTCPLASVVPVALCAPSTKLTFLPTTA